MPRLRFSPAIAALAAAYLLSLIYCCCRATEASAAPDKATTAGQRHSCCHRSAIPAPRPPAEKAPADCPKGCPKKQLNDQFVEAADQVHVSVATSPTSETDSSFDGEMVASAALATRHRPPPSDRASGAPTLDVATDCHVYLI